MIRILHIFSPTFGHVFSGDSKLWVRLFQKWTDEYVSHLVVFVDRGEIVEARSIKSAFGEKNSSIQNPLRRRHRVLWAFKLMWLLSLKRHRYDILHVHTNYWGALLVGPLSKLLGRPSVFQIVRMGMDDPTTLVSESLGNIKFWCFKRFNRILCISEALKLECFFQGLGVGKTIMLINPVDSDVFSPYSEDHKSILLRRRLNLPEKSYIILSVGSVIPRKGMDLLVDAFILLVKDNADLKLVLVGPVSRDESASVDEVFVSGLKRKIYRAGLAKHAIFTGRIDDDGTLVDYYRAADIFALPTYQEGLPNVLLEAMCVSLPIVVTHLPGSTDLVIYDGKTGFLIPPDDVTALTEKLQWIIDNPSRARELGDMARVHAVQNFGFDSWQKNMTSILSSLLEEKLRIVEHIEKTD